MPAGPRYLTSLLCSRWPAWESWDGVCEIGGGVEGSWERGGVDGQCDDDGWLWYMRILAAALLRTEAD